MDAVAPRGQRQTRDASTCAEMLLLRDGVWDFGVLGDQVRLRVEGPPVSVSLGRMVFTPALDVHAQYDIVLRTTGRAPGRLSRVPRPRYRPEREGDRILLPGGSVWLSRKSPQAEVHHPRTDSSQGRFVTTMLMEFALAHAAAWNGHYVVHAAAVEMGARRWLVSAPSRHGKSTLAAAVLACGGRLVSDDSVVIGRDTEGRIVAGALRKDLSLRRGSLELLPDALRRKLCLCPSALESRWVLAREHCDRFLLVSAPEGGLVWRRDRRRRRFVLERLNQAETMAHWIGAGSPLFVSRPSPVRGPLLELLAEFAGRSVGLRVTMGRGLLERPCEVLCDLDRAFAKLSCMGV